MSPCEPWCRPPAKTAGAPWTCPECGTRWFVEEHVEQLIAWCREYVVPTMTETQLDFLRAFMSGQAYLRGMHPEAKRNRNRGQEQR